jgi:UDP-N-acetylmuramoylalanine--D-glutamate ligase
MGTRSRISWSELRGAAVGVWGLGVEGRASIRKLGTLGLTPVLVDDRPAVEGAAVEGATVTATLAGGLELLAQCEVVVKAPGISRYRDDVRALEDGGTPVVGGLGLWMEEVDRARVACVTGTKGKSTTTAIAGHLLRRLGYDCMVGGNLGAPPWDPDAGAHHDRWVVETSSFQATDLASSPPVVAVTSLHADHLDWHGDVATYVADKLSATSQPGAELTIADASSPLLHQYAALLGGAVRWVHDPGPEVARWTGALGLPGAHNRRNALIAGELLLALGVPEAADDATLEQAAREFHGLPSRLTMIGSVHGVDFVDDSLSTNALATMAALETFADRRVALLVGGHERGIGYDELARAIAGRALPTLVVATGDNGPRIAEAVARLAPATEVIERADLGAATRDAFDWSVPDGVVLLSPAAASFGPFTDFGHRAAVFADALRACGGQPA